MNVTEHLITCLVEEGSEVAQAGAKALRFGLDDYNPNTGHTNKTDLVKEFNDMIGVLELMQENGIELPGLFNRDAIDRKKARLAKWMGYSVMKGTLQSTPPTV